MLQGATLNDLAERVDAEFGDDVACVIDSSNPSQKTLIIHIEAQSILDTATSVESFVEHIGGTTRRETFDAETDIRVIAAL